MSDVDQPCSEIPQDTSQFDPAQRDGHRVARRPRSPRTAAEYEIAEEASLAVLAHSALKLEFSSSEASATLRISSIGLIVPHENGEPRALLVTSLLEHPLRTDLLHGAEGTLNGRPWAWAMTPASTAYWLPEPLDRWAAQVIAHGWTPRWVRFSEDHELRLQTPELLEELP